LSTSRLVEEFRGCLGFFNVLWRRSDRGAAIETILDAIGRLSDLEGRSIDVGEYLLTLFEEKGLLVVQRRNRRAGVSLDRATLTDEALTLLRDFLTSAKEANAP